MDTIDSRQLGAVIKTARHQANISKTMLSKMLEIPRYDLVQYERRWPIPTQLLIKLIQQGMQAYVQENKPKRRSCPSFKQVPNQKLT